MNHASTRRGKWPAADIYGITAEEYSNGRSNIEVVRAMIDAGVKVIQYREKEKKKLYKYQECIRIREMTQKAGVTFIINDDIDLALLVKPDGVHIGQEDLPIEEVRQLVGEEMIIGLSTHSPQQAQEAVKRGADYIGVGPVFATRTKKDVSAATGLDYVKYVAEHIPLPSVAIGGIKTDNIASVRQAGADCFALITDIVGAADIGARIKELRARLV
ncbi:thiamine phosphate synthase [Acetonema longum]|uniref:Thiamine-phosphate synthase n=1 Tax=Acetonema longum DSM 6540 TaxID=1009370 RepID=F7NKT4_9FIRM|nr:thiamine phosphate synthase [Acetonema longum]EGO63388.1 thiamine-phosphate pyrophosphorylase [Acetonema longum DSM 6540]